jgi:hypothetical protein
VLLGALGAASAGEPAPPARGGKRAVDYFDEGTAHYEESRWAQPAGGSNPACPGGQGGKGGNGGPGGGGRGGHSIGVAYMGAMPSGAPITIGAAGIGGDGGQGNEMAGKGAAGVALEMQVFP